MPRASHAEIIDATEEFTDGEVERGVKECAVAGLFGDFNRDFIITIGPQEPDTEMLEMASMVTGNFTSYEFFSLYRLYRNKAWKRFRLTLQPHGKFLKQLAEIGETGTEEELPWYKGIFEERKKA